MVIPLWNFIAFKFFIVIFCSNSANIWENLTLILHLYSHIHHNQVVEVSDSLCLEAQLPQPRDATRLKDGCQNLSLYSSSKSKKNIPNGIIFLPFKFWLLRMLSRTQREFKKCSLIKFAIPLELLNLTSNMLELDPLLELDACFGLPHLGWLLILIGLSGRESVSTS